MFTNRRQAGQRLAVALEHLLGVDAVVVALPRGGVPVAAEVARYLHLPLDIRLPHKIGAPFNPELAIASVTEDGELVADPAFLAKLGIDARALERLKTVEMQAVRRRVARLRGHVRRENLKGRTVIIVDDGIATGATVEAAVRMVVTEGACRVVVATPVAASSAVERLSREAEVVCVRQSDSFAGISEFYLDFTQVTDEQVLELLRQAVASRVASSWSG